MFTLWYVTELRICQLTRKKGLYEMKKVNKILCALLSVLFSALIFSPIGFAEDESTSKYDIIGDYVFYSDKYAESPDGIITERLPWVMNQSADDEEIDFYVSVNYNIRKDEFTGNIKLAKAFFTEKNKEFVKTLPGNVKVTFIDSYSPVIGMTGTKAAIYEIAKMDTVASMWEGFKYLAIDPLTQGTNANYFSATLKIDGKEISFIENEYYRAYADVFGKYFCDKFNSEKPEKKITDELAAAIKEAADPTYVTVIFAETPSDTAAAAETLKIKESDIVALCKTYPAAMIKISADNSDGIVENENVKAIYSAFPTAIHREFVNNSILEEKYKPNSADARKILRYAARLDSAPQDMAEGKKFFFMSDADLDGKLTSSDARTALRIAAKLEEGKVYTKESEGLGSFWQDAYYIK